MNLQQALFEAGLADEKQLKDAEKRQQERIESERTTKTLKVRRKETVIAMDGTRYER